MALCVVVSSCSLLFTSILRGYTVFTFYTSSPLTLSICTHDGTCRYSKKHAGWIHDSILLMNIVFKGHVSIIHTPHIK